MTTETFKKQYKKIYKYYNKKIKRLNKNFDFNFFNMIDSFALKLACLCDYYIITADKELFTATNTKILSITNALQFYEKYKNLTLRYLNLLASKEEDQEKLEECLKNRSDAWYLFCKEVMTNLEGWFIFNESKN